MTKQKFIDYVRQYSYSLFYIREGMKSHVKEGRIVFSSYDVEESSKEHLVFMDFYHWTWHKSGLSRAANETFTKRNFEQILDVMNDLSEKLLNDNDIDFDEKIIQKTWTKFIYNLMLDFKEVEQWTKQNII